jgi:uncharacterized protein
LIDFVFLIDAVGEPMAATLGGLAIGFVLGFALQRSGFCTRQAVIDIARGESLRGPAIWLMAFAVALIAVQSMLALGMITIDDSRYFATGQSLSGALVGGLIFGVGMILTRGCVSRLVVLGSSGNVRALYCVALVALASFATLYGFLTWPRDQIGGLATTALTGGNMLVDHVVAGNFNGAIAGALALAFGLFLSVRARIGAWRAIGALVVGLCVAAGWAFTATLNTQVFDPIAVDSVSYIRPLAQTAGYLLGEVALPTFDFGLVAGTVLGALVAAVVSRSFKLATFSEPGVPGIARYTAGSLMLGFGGVLAAGCTIGAGLTGTSALAISATVAITSMVSGGIAADALIDRRGQTPYRA